MKNIDMWIHAGSSGNCRRTASQSDRSAVAAPAEAFSCAWHWGSSRAAPNAAAPARNARTFHGNPLFVRLSPLSYHATTAADETRYGRPAVKSLGERLPKCTDENRKARRRYVNSVVVASRELPTDRPDIGYAMIFPGMTIVKILFVDIAAEA